MTEQEIIAICQKWNMNFFQELYEKYVDHIYKFIYLKTYDTDISEDLTSQTFLKAIDKIHTFQNNDQANFKAWLYRIAYNNVIDMYKSKQEHLEIDSIEDEWYSENFWENFDNKELLKNIMTYLNTLNPKHKQILIMRIWDDLSYKEISEITQESVDNCKKIVSRTLAKIPHSYLNIIWLILITSL